jgi:hypothetical protein
VKVYVKKPCHSHVSFVGAKTRVFLTMEKKIPLLFTFNDKFIIIIVQQNNRHKKIRQFIKFNKTHKDNYFFICARLVIFFDFLQSDCLQQRAAPFTISWTVVQKSYFLAKNRGVKTIFKLNTLPKMFKNPPYQY